MSRQPGRLRARWLALPLLVAAIASCLDGPTEPLMIGELRIRPTFAPGEDPAAFGLTIDSARVTAARRSPVETVVDAAVPYEAGGTLGWLLDLTSDPETFDARVELYGGGERLYEGTAAPAVSLGFADGRAATDVLVAYVGAPVTSPIDRIVVRPANATLIAAGATQAYEAEALDAGGATIQGVTFAWSSSLTGVATIDAATGVATAVAEGTTFISATAGGVSGSATLKVDLSGATAIASITVTPPSATLTGVGGTQQYVAQAFDGNGDPIGGATFVWTSSAAAVATVDAATGLATATGHGAATIQASAGGATGSATLTVDLTSTVVSVVVSPPTATLTAVGATQQFTAEARDGAGQPVPGMTFDWSSNATAVASVDASTGLATAAGDGTATITASAGSASGSATLTVNLSTSVPIASIVVTPDPASLTSLGATQQFGAQAFDASGAVIPGVVFTWTSSNGAVATIDAATGLATATGMGLTTITATAGAVSGSATLSVDLTTSVVSITVSPTSATLTALGGTQQFTAVARDGAGQLLPGVPFGWSSGAPGIATVDPATGLATAVSNGTTSITATAGSASGSATLEVAQAIASIDVSPAAVVLTALGATQQYAAIARDANGFPVTGVVFDWSSGTPSVATIDAATGLATAAGNGSTVITASAGGVDGTAVLDVAQRVASIVVSPDTARLDARGETVQLTATAFDANGHAVAGVAVTWSSDAPLVASVDAATGLVTANDGGIATITATGQGAAAGVSGVAVVLVMR